MSIESRRWEALAAACRGDTEASVQLLEALMSDGEERARASYVNVLLFQNHWGECLQNACQFLTNCPDGDPCNGFNDMVVVLALLGRETGVWDTLIDCCTNALDRLARATDQRYKVRNAAVFRHLIAYALRQGEPPHELLRFPPTPPPEPPVLRTRYQEAAANVSSLRPDLVGRPIELATYLFHLADGFEQDEEMIAAYLVHPLKRERFQFRDILQVARALCRRSHFDDAWELVASYLENWYPGSERTRFAPIELLTDPALRPMMTPERCNYVLRSPRAIEVFLEPRRRAPKSNTAAKVRASGRSPSSKGSQVKRQFSLWPGEEKVIAVFLNGEALVSRVWTEEQLPSGDCLGERSVSFLTLDDNREGFVSVTVLLGDEFVADPAAVEHASVPFTVPEDRQVLVSTLMPLEDYEVAVPVGDYLLHYETGYLRPPAEEDEFVDEEDNDEPTMWCRLTFVDLKLEVGRL